MKKVVILMVSAMSLLVALPAQAKLPAPGNVSTDVRWGGSAYDGYCLRVSWDGIERNGAYLSPTLYTVMLRKPSSHGGGIPDYISGGQSQVADTVWTNVSDLPRVHHSNRSSFLATFCGLEGDQKVVVRVRGYLLSASPITSRAQEKDLKGRMSDKVKVDIPANPSS
ncbi:MAG: hypothetical protein OXF90_11740 [Chloroflexi bacterium]|nr:hypothetical protein [Chloroflexota bacterium]